jgi:hypothetical protein
MAIFKQGTDRFEQQEREMQNRSYKTFREMFFVDDDKGTKTIAFLHDDPIQFMGHNVKDGNRFDIYVCGVDVDDEDSGCRLCESGARPTLYGAYLVYIDQHGSYKDRRGERVQRKPEVRIWLVGARKMGAIQTLRARCKNTLQGFMCDVVKTGTGQQTVYQVFKNEDADYPDTDEIREAFPEKIQNAWRGTEKSTIKLLTDALLEYSQFDNDTANVDDDDEDVEERPKSRLKVSDKSDAVPRFRKKAKK